MISLALPPRHRLLDTAIQAVRITSHLRIPRSDPTFRSHWPHRPLLSRRNSPLHALFLADSAALLALALLHARRGAPFSPAMAEPAPSATARTRGTLLAPSVWQKRWWIDKTARLLRGGEGLGPTTMSVPCCRSPRQRSRVNSWRISSASATPCSISTCSFSASSPII